VAAHIRSKADYNHHGPAECHRHLLQILHGLHDIVFLERFRLIVYEIIIPQIRLCSF
jgi:hypothetical protein